MSREKLWGDLDSFTRHVFHAPKKSLAEGYCRFYNLKTSSVLGMTGPAALEFKVDNARALLITPSTLSPNIIGGSPYNSVASGVSGAFIGGGGSILTANRIMDNFCTIGGVGKKQPAGGKEA